MKNVFLNLRAEEEKEKEEDGKRTRVHSVQGTKGDKVGMRSEANWRKSMELIGRTKGRKGGGVAEKRR